MPLIREAIRELILIEGRIDDIAQKYDLDEFNSDIHSNKKEFETERNDFLELVKNDPSGNQKYLAWMAAQLIDHNEYVEEIIELVTKFHEIRNRLKEKDLYKYTSVAMLINSIANAPLSKSQIKKIQKEQSKKVYETSEFIVISPKSTEASCYYGYGTKWCISGKEDNYFNSYTDRGAQFYFIINKTAAPASQYGKIAFAIVNSDFTIYDSKDEQMIPEEFMDVVGEEQGVKILDAIAKDMNSSITELFNHEFIAWTAGDIVAKLKDENLERWERNELMSGVINTPSLSNNEEIQLLLVNHDNGIEMLLKSPSTSDKAVVIKHRTWRRIADNMKAKIQGKSLAEKGLAFDWAEIISRIPYVRQNVIRFIMKFIIDDMKTTEDKADHKKAIKALLENNKTEFKTIELIDDIEDSDMKAYQAFLISRHMILDKFSKYIESDNEVIRTSFLVGLGAASIMKNNGQWHRLRMQSKVTIQALNKLKGRTTLDDEYIDLIIKRIEKDANL